MAQKKDKSSGTAPKGKKFTWQVHGVCKPKGKATATSDLVHIQEQQSNLGWNDCPTRTAPPISTTPTQPIFGKPIDVNVAISLIEDSFKLAQKHLFGDGEHRDFTQEILKLSYGITFDKSIILKILSQPKCEGLRSYLCYRDNHYSLVMLGVDKDGYDLGYYRKPEGKKAADSSVDNTGLLAEYGHPPGLVNFENPNQIDDHYVVLKYCNLPTVEER